jgi:hypothetical protein
MTVIGLIVAIGYIALMVYTLWDIETLNDDDPRF